MDELGVLQQAFGPELARWIDGSYRLAATVARQGKQLEAQAKQLQGVAEMKRRVVPEAVPPAEQPAADESLPMLGASAHV